MKLPELPQQHKRWDHYKAFHWGVGKYGTHGGPFQFVAFDTGELICNLLRPDPDLRGLYPGLNVEVTTSKETAPLVTPDGRPVAKTWLDDQGMQYLLVDHDTRHVVRLDAPIEQARDTRPKRFRQTYGAYFAGEGLPPLGGSIVVHTNKWLTPEENEELDTLLCPARARLALEGYQPGRRATVRLNQLLGKSFDDLTEAEKTAIATNKLLPARYTFDHLLLRS